MASVDSAPASVKAWLAAERAPDPTPGRRTALSPDAVFDHGPFSAQGADAVLEALAFLMPAGWIGNNVEWNILPAQEDGALLVRGTGPGGGPLPLHVPGDIAPQESCNGVEFVFTLDDKGLIAKIHGGVSHIQAPDAAPTLRPGDAAPDFVLPDFDGIKVALRQEGTKATVVVFTCNNCPYALAWHDRVQKVGRDYAARGVRLLQINSNDPSMGGVGGTVEHSRKRVAEGHFAGPYLIDERQVVARRWGAKHTPEVFIVDAKGIIAYHGAPDEDCNEESHNAAWIRGALDHILAGTAPNPAHTKPSGCSIKWTM